MLSAVTTVVDVHTRVSDLYSVPHDQIGEQLPACHRDDQGASGERADQQQGVRPADHAAARHADQDAHRPADAGRPRRVDRARSGRSRRSSSRTRWRSRRSAANARGAAVPAGDGHAVRLAVRHLARRCRSFRPTKCGTEGSKTSILLLRIGESRQGVVGLYQPGLPGEQGMGLSVRFMGISRKAIASYLVSLYCSLAVLTDDALAVLDNVEIGKYHEYPDTYAK